MPVLSQNAYACGSASPSGVAGDIMFNETANVPAYCDGTQWIAMTGGDGELGPTFDSNAANCTVNNGGPLVQAGIEAFGNAYEVWADNGTVYVSSTNAGLFAFTFDGTNFTAAGSIDPGRVEGVWSDGTYVYAAARDDGLIVYSYNGSAFTELDRIATSGRADAINGDENYIYISMNNDSIGNPDAVAAYSFDGSTLSFLDDYAVTNDTLSDVCSANDGFVHVSGNGHLTALAFDGTTFSLAGTEAIGSILETLWCEGTYIFSASRSSSSRVRSYTFDGSSYTAAGDLSAGSANGDMWYDGTHLYVPTLQSSDRDVRVFSYDGSSFTQVNTLTTPNAFGPASVWGDGTYIYAGDIGGGLLAYSGFACTSTVVGGNSTNTQIVSDGLVGHWRLDETSGTVAKDSSGNDNDGTVTNTTFDTSSVRGPLKNALNFGSTLNDYVEAGTGAADSFHKIRTDDLSLSLWFKADEACTSTAFLVGNKLADSGSDGYYLRLNCDDNFVQAFLAGSGFQSQSSGNDTIQKGKWHHYAVTYDRDSVITVYIDGVQVGGTPDISYMDGEDITGTRPFRMGLSPTAQGPFDGEIDDVRLYKRVLTPEEVRQIYLARDGIRYNIDQRTMEYFDGNRFVSMTRQWPEPGGTYTPSSSSYVDEINALSPIVYYRLNDPSVTMVDATGTYNGNHNNNPTYGASPSPADAGGASIYFDGASSEYSRAVDDPLFDTTQGTVIAWFNIDDASGGLETVFAKDGGGDTDGQFYVGVNNGDIDGRVQQDGGSTAFTYDPSSTSLGADVQNGTWYMLSMAYGTGGVDFYLNDVFLGTETRLTRTDSDRNFFIGAENSTGSAANFFTGFIDEVSWLPTKLDSTAIANLYNSGASGVGSGGSGDSSLVLHYKLDETEGTTIIDSSGRGNNGSVENGLDPSVHSVQGAIGRALYLKSTDPTASNSGGNPGISPPGLLADTDDITASVWLYPIVTAGGQGRVFENNGLRRNGSGLLTWNINGGAQLASTATAPDGRWTHVALTYDSSTRERKIYVNGVEDVSQIDAGINFGTFFTRIGWNFDGYEGYMDDIRLYSRILSDGEIMQLYQMGAAVGANTALPQGCPNEGDVCDDGTIYAGDSPDGTIPMFTTPEDAPTTFPWSNGNGLGTNTTTGATDSTTGETNTLTIVTFDSDTTTSGFQPHQAAQYCYDLVAHGADDWYLPSQNELSTVCSNADAIGNFVNSGGYPAESYWTSREDGGDDDFAWFRNFSSCAAGNSVKGVGLQVRCVRKGLAPRCASPYGMEGDIVYNTTHDVMQFCDGARWRAIGK